MLREEGVVRIYDIFFDYDVLLSTDAFFRKIIQGAGVPARDVERRVPRPVRQVRPRAREGARHRPEVAALGARTRRGVPIYTSSPGDSSIGMNVAALALEGNKCVIDPNRDVNETASIVLAAKRGGGKSGGADLRRRQPEELHAPDRAADSGSARHRREGARLLPADHRRAPRHGRPLRRDAGRGGELGQDRSRPAAGCGRLLSRLDRRAAAAHGVRARAARSRARSSGCTIGARR